MRLQRKTKLKRFEYSSVAGQNNRQIGCSGNSEIDLDGLLRFFPDPPHWKRALDIPLSLIAILVLSPIWIGAILALIMSRSGPIFFCQTRIGLGERTYRMIKFRTLLPSQSQSESLGMMEREIFELELTGKAVPETETKLFRSRQQPATKVGAYLRYFSIDELPQLINVLRGEMSLVGPRPALPWEVDMFSIEQRRRHTVLPGMTGLWQVRGRNRLSTAQMLELDLEYIDCLSLKNDLKILFNTPRAAIWDRHTA